MASTNVKMEKKETNNAPTVLTILNSIFSFSCFACLVVFMFKYYDTMDEVGNMKNELLRQKEILEERFLTFGLNPDANFDDRITKVIEQVSFICFLSLIVKSHWW